MGVGLGVVVAVSVDGMEDAVGSFVKTVTEGVVVSVFVVISHITLVLLWGVDSRSSRLYSNFRWIAGVDGVNLPAVAGGLFVAWLGAEVGVTLLSCVPSGDGTSTFTILTLGDVNLSGGVVGGRSVDSVEVSVVGPVLDFDLASNVALVGFLVAVEEREKVSSLGREESRGKVETECRSDNSKRKRVKRVCGLSTNNRGFCADSCTLRQNNMQLERSHLPVASRVFDLLGDALFDALWLLVAAVSTLR